MHKSAYEIGAKFLERYWAPHMKNILEVGAFNVNGTLKDFKQQKCEWVGVDLEPGNGVDIVIERASKLPFEDDSFDLVIATSVFEHDPTFWLTFSEMLRVVKPNGFVYICAPSNGWVHRYPMDVYRFYPDTGVALVEWGRREHQELHLVESFVSERDGDIWNDFCAIFSKTQLSQNNKIHTDTPCSNVWSDGVFLENTVVEATEDMRIIENLTQELASSHHILDKNQALLRNLENFNSRISAELSHHTNELAIVNKELELSIRNYEKISHEMLLVHNSISWRITSPLRNLKSWIGRR